MISFLLIVGLGYGVAYWICSTGLEFWRAALGFTVAFFVAWLGGTIIAAFIAAEFASTDISRTTLSLLGKGFWWASISAGFGVYRARFKLKTGETAPAFKFPSWVMPVFGGLVVVGIAFAVALPAFQGWQKGRSVQTSTNDAAFWANDKVVKEPDWDKGTIKPPPQQSEKIWSGNAFDPYDTVAEIETKARTFPALNEQRAWAAVIAWQANELNESKVEPNVALYRAVGTVLEGLKSQKGVCRPGRIDIVDKSSASEAFPVGTRMTLLECDP